MARPDHTLPRLFVDAPMGAALPIPLSTEQTHYLAKVLRRKAGDAVRIFNGQHGEWRATVTSLERRSGSLQCDAMLRQQDEVPDVWLVFAPVKKTGTDFMIEKATELGVRRFIPVHTTRTQSDRLKLDRARARIVEAAEQCERLDLPPIHDPTPMERVLDDWPAARPLFVLDETGKGPSLANAVAENQGPAGILVGPEGGFTEPELDSLSKLDFTIRVTLGPRILRAETAALAGLAIWQSAFANHA